MNSRIAKRVRAVAAYERLGSWKGAAKEAGVDVPFVKTWVQRHKQGMGLDDKPRPGRPCLIRLDNAEAIASILDGMEQKLGPRQIARLLHDRHAVSADPETVRRFMKAHLGRPLLPKKKPKLTPTHKRSRLAFARKWLRRDWSNVVVTDSKYFWLCPRGRGPVEWVPYGHGAPDTPAEKNCFKVHAYAGVCKTGRTKLFATVGTSELKSETKGVTGSVYKKLLEEQLIPACRKIVTYPIAWTFQQDNARAHTSKLVKHWLQQKPFQVMQWPSKSPDLSWIENMWAFVSKEMTKIKGLTPQNFEQHLQQVWATIPQHVHDKHFQSIRKRLQACIDAEGGSTKY